ncbi:MAG TPA: hypothetical protein VME41_15095 [Stellaceae bacterium]|nr:hypothetical protein [Stellaceae bacterium]
MRKIAAVTGIITAGLLPSSGVVSAQEAQTTLPELSVTAAPTLHRFAPTMGMMGNVRVEESKWPLVPCTGSPLDDPAAPGKCQEGPKVQNFMSFGGSGMVPAGYGDCTIEHPLITATIGRFAVESDVLVFDPYKVTAVQTNSKCTIWTGYQNLPGDFKDMNEVARRGVDWRNFVAGDGRAGTQSTMAFSEAGHDCLALERLGPPWHGGYVWVMHATMCDMTADGTATTPIEEADIDAVVGALRIRIYDPAGNLMPPPQN